MKLPILQDLDQAALQRLISIYPYFVAPYILLAKQDYTEASLEQAAIRITSREYLKNILQKTSFKTTQQSIINNFAQKPNRFLPKPLSENDSLSDLSIPSTMLGEGLVTESLARILHQQGKIDRAIEIYRQLMTQAPEKRTYFENSIRRLLDENKTN